VRHKTPRRHALPVTISLITLRNSCPAFSRAAERVDQIADQNASLHLRPAWVFLLLPPGTVRSSQSLFLLENRPSSPDEIASAREVAG